MPHKKEWYATLDDRKRHGEKVATLDDRERHGEKVATLGDRKRHSIQSIPCQRSRKYFNEDA